MAHKITPHEVEKISKLARLALGPAEAKAASVYLTDIIGYVESFAALPTKNTPKYTLAERDGRTMRRDEAKPFSSRDDLLRGAATNERGFVEAPPLFTPLQREETVLTGGASRRHDAALSAGQAKSK